MKNTVKSLFIIDRKPLRGLTLLEWAVVGYMLLTLLLMMALFTRLHDPAAMLWGRARVLFVMAALWAVYRLAPCRMTMLLRVVGQMSILAWWYPDTYEFNRLLPNLDHLFASYEQSLFGSQPALTFSASWSSPFWSELMSFGYAAYYPMVVIVVLYYFLKRYDEFVRCAYIIMASFFIYYVIFIFLPVVGPTFYYHAVGVDTVARGVLPAVGDYFDTHQGCLPTPGYTDGVFYALVESAKSVGERPTAAFPSSHVGVSTILMMLALHSRNRTLTLSLLPVYLLLCLSTVYIQAHYVIDTIAGALSGVLFYALLLAVTSKPQRASKKRK